jgi:hypothetical protein
MPEDPDMEDVRDDATRLNLLWKHHKRTAHWEIALGRVVVVHDLLAGSGRCIMRVCFAATALFVLVTAGKGAWDVVVQFLRP